MEKNNDIKFLLFSCLLLFIIVGGFILMHNSNIKLDNKSTKKDNTTKDIRINKDEDFIYYTDNERIIEEYEIEYKQIHINFGNYSEIEKDLNDETDNFKNNVKYIDENDIEDEEDNPENQLYDNLLSAKYKTYENYVYGKYISLLVNYYNFTRSDFMSYESSKTYVFDKKTGELYNNDTLLAQFSLTKEDVLEKVENAINDLNLVKENEQLDAKATVDNIEQMALFVDKIGRLSISILVKSDQKDYNEVIVLS